MSDIVQQTRSYSAEWLGENGKVRVRIEMEVPKESPSEFVPVEGIPGVIGYTHREVVRGAMHCWDCGAQFDDAAFWAHACLMLREAAVLAMKRVGERQSLIACGREHELHRLTHREILDQAIAEVILARRGGGA